MTQILLVEPSPTLRFGLNRLLQQAGYHVESIDKYASLFDKLVPKNGHTDSPPDLLIVGWPTRDRSAQCRLITELNREKFKQVPVVIFARTIDETNLNALSDRPRLMIQLWSDFQKSLSRIKQMVELSEQALEARSNHQFKALLVDDSKSVRTIYGRKLKQMGLDVTLAEDADDAWEKLQQQHFDMAIIDYFMPGDNGAMLCQRIADSGRFPGMIRAILTGTYKEEIISECINAGARECMFKNESMTLFQARVTAMIKQLQSNVKLDQQNRDLVNILTSIGEGIYGVDQNGVLTFINPTGLEILRYSAPRELLGKKAHELFHHSDEYGRSINDETNYLYQAYLLQDSLRDWETVFWTADQTPVHVECTIQPLSHNQSSGNGSVVVFKNISERKLIEDEINWQLNHDHLTQLLNRTYFERLLQQEIQTVQVTQTQSALLYIDLDNFKQINDQAGHSAGDQLLVTISEKIRSRLRHRDLAARLGGDEFAVLLHDIKPSALESLANSFRDVLAQTHFSYQDQEFPVSGSIGVSAITQQCQDIKQLMAQADRACAKAKQAGKNQIVVCQDHEFIAAENTAKGWKNRLKQALSEHKFTLLYQPIYSSSDIYKHLEQQTDNHVWQGIDEISPTEYEVLIRLEDHDGELLSANAFLSDAERFDLIADIDLWVLKQALSNLTKAQLAKPVNINFSAHSLIDDTNVKQIESLLTEYSDVARLIRIELKEHHILHYREALAPVMERLVDLGCQFQIDDFGRNFSLFSRLRELPIMGIKIDGLFTANIAWDPVDKKLLHSMIEVARTSQIKTTVKSIESLDSLKHIEHGGVDLIQGYLLGKPIEIES
ncbi:diguanylate cyclase domain-containing protein [Pleionea litopenaei]|uniref:Diguanylate cyclase n=1 Tax=Pleionea litopenaei TaxID=3070815 RepID=A0AA51RVD0_9GAMM|nr:diguanylate cyclase [Pleionea sp. HL-JVS1]WMS88446.1 diguanylate cyclase [Pleionea sp. HL-JVS1]